MKNKDEIKKKIAEIEVAMNQADFWNDKNLAQSKIKELQDLKDSLEGFGKYDRGNAILTIFAGVGGDDAEDFARMLLEMYIKFSDSKGWQSHRLSSHETDFGGYKTVTYEITGKNAYGTLKHESGVHRLVRKSPFNSAGKRQTSFAMVEITPEFEKETDYVLPEEEITIEHTKSSGPGGQNVNKRETAVRITHIPTKLTAFIDSERSQNQNKEKALAILKGKVYNKRQEEQKLLEDGMTISKTVDAEWGSQIRSYVLHPYKLVKDHRTEVEVRDTDKVFSGDLDVFISAMKEKSNQ